MATFHQDEIGLYKPLSDGRVLRLTRQIYNTKLTLSQSQESWSWEEGW
jgi:hypothetical protein